MSNDTQVGLLPQRAKGETMTSKTEWQRHGGFLQDAVRRCASLESVARSLMILAIVICLCFSCANSIGAVTQPRLRVISLNVYVGFHQDEKRHANALKWVAEQNPDVVALQELNGYTIERLQKDARSWGHSYVQLCEVKTGFHLGLTSRKPIKNVHLITKDGIWHGIIHGETFGVDFFVLHLAPKDEGFRLAETKIVWREIMNIQSDDRPSVLLGDFNSACRFDLVKDVYLQHASKEEPKVRKHLGFALMDQYLSEGLVDLVHQEGGPATVKQASYPSLLKLNGTPWYCRIDFILASSSLAKKCRMARVVKDLETGQLSDHYPVMADFNWPGNRGADK